MVQVRVFLSAQKRNDISKAARPGLLAIRDSGVTRPHSKGPFGGPASEVWGGDHVLQNVQFRQGGQIGFSLSGQA